MVLVIETLWDVRHRSPLCERMLARSRAAGVKPMIDEHRAILDAIAAHDGPGARKAMRDHLGRVIDNLLRRSEEHTYELQSLMRHSYAVLSMTKKNTRCRF